MNRVKLKDLCSFGSIYQYGINASAEQFCEGKLRYLRISDIDDFGNIRNNDKKYLTLNLNDEKKYILKEGDIVFARTGASVGRTYYHENKNGKFVFAGYLIKFILDDKKVNAKYLKYYTTSNEYKLWVRNLSVGSTRGNINAQTFANCPIILPSRKQQDFLVIILSALDNKIEINNKINEQLEAMVSALYNYWFVQFDFPDENGKPYFSSGGKMKFSPELKKEIPVGWEVKNLIDIFNFDKGIEPGQSNYLNNKSTDNHILFYRVADINSIPSIYIDKSNINKSKIAKTGDCLVSFDGSVGKVSNNINGAFCSGLQKISDKTGLYNNSMCYFIFNDKNIQNTIKKYATGSIILHASKSIKYLQIPYCESKYILFQNTINDLYKKIINNKKQKQYLSSLRDWLLPMLMNGQVT